MTPATPLEPRSDDEVWLVVGLGNPGPPYAGNRHNVGAMVLDLIGARSASRFATHKGRADVVQTRLAGRRAVLAKPRSYMNDSGGAVSSLRSWFGVDPRRIAVVHDELDLPFGSLRLKLGGGDNGHNGLRSMRRSLGTGDVHRIRVGIGRPPGRMDAAAYVLRDFAGAERKELPFLLDRAADAVEALVGEGLEVAQNAYNS